MFYAAPVSGITIKPSDPGVYTIRQFNRSNKLPNGIHTLPILSLVRVCYEPIAAEHTNANLPHDGRRSDSVRPHVDATVGTTYPAVGSVCLGGSAYR